MEVAEWVGDIFPVGDTGGGGEIGARLAIPANADDISPLCCGSF